MSISVTVTGETTISLTVSPETAVSVLASGGIGPAGFLTAPGTSTNAFGTFQVQAGPGVTISTTSGVFQIASYSTTEAASFAPVQSVAGRTGAVVLQAADITTGTLDIARIPTISYTALSNVPASFTPEVHTHSTNDIISFTAAASAAAPVQSVAGRTGTISLAAADVSGLAAVATSGSYTSLSDTPVSFPPGTHTHTTTEIESFTSAAAAAAPVQGIVAGSNVTVTTSTSGIYTIAAEAGGGIGSAVESLNGQTGAITIQSGSNVTVSTAAGTITIAAPAPGDALPSQGGNGDRVLGSDGTSASWLTRYSVVEPVLVAGTGITFTKSSQAGSITIATDGTQLGDAPITPVFGLSGSSITLTVVPNGRFYIVEVFDAAQGKYVFYGQSTSTAVSGTVLLSGTAYNQANHYRFRALNADSVPSPWGYTDGAPAPSGEPSGGGSGGGIAMSYLFS